MDSYGERPRRYAEQINIWWSKHQGAWITCAWVTKDMFDGYYGNAGTVYIKERVAHPSLDDATKYIRQNYKETE